MKKFRFRLAALRKLREVHRDELRSKLAEASQAVQLLETQISAVQEDIDQQQVARRSAINGTKSDINRILAAGRYQTILRAQQTTMQDQIKLLTTEVERRRQAVIEADQQVQILDKLEEKQRAEQRQMLQRAEVKELDEIASRRAEVHLS